MSTKDSLTDVFKQKGWIGDWSGFGGGRKGDWEAYLDTSSWMIVSHAKNPRVWDVPMPSESLEGWTVNLIEHLCRMEDERFRLRNTLLEIQIPSPLLKDAKGPR